tara:strand:+ start:31284 stop:31793 length:510 start_codon:yes stop_codon:yes gene_type:complete
VEGLDVEITEIGHGASMDIGDMSIDAFEVDHRPMAPAFGYSFKEDDEHLVLSGDTGPCDTLIEAAMDCDVLVHDVLLKHEMQPLEGVRSQETIDQVASYHATADQVGAIAARANVGCLILTHFVPPRFDESRLIEMIHHDYGGRILCGEDLLRVDVSDPASAAVHREDC